ncbi:Synaptogyrin-4 [Apodemus speciosus]|uniref:Synaptogyrin-4 n=1 Tax=Apodemus speciosus TaxID=105296 RepID=A0ABQ0EYV5_APOSI
MVFSLVIFSSLLTDGYQNRTESPQLRCVLNSNHMACSFAVGAGFLSFLSCLLFLAIDAHESRMAGTRFKTAFQLLDFILAVLWAGVWFVAFCFLASQWQHSRSKHFLLGSSSARIFQAYLAFQDLRDEAPVPYKRSLEEGSVVLNTLSSSSTTSPAHPPITGPNSLTYTSSALSPYMTAPKAPRLAMMPDS